MEPFGRFLNVIDVEATCWNGPPPPGQTSEILNHAGLPLECRHHSGADDAWNIGALVLRMGSAQQGRPDNPWVQPHL